VQTCHVLVAHEDAYLTDAEHFLLVQEKMALVQEVAVANEPLQQSTLLQSAKMVSLLKMWNCFLNSLHAIVRSTKCKL